METDAAVGVTENANTAVLVTVRGDGSVLDRRHVALTEGLPTHPHHHEGSWAMGRYLSTPGARRLSLAEAVALVERVQAAAASGALRALQALTASVEQRITRLALRACPELPRTVEERISDSRAQTMADSVMYRQALATAAVALGWAVYWYDRDHVFVEAEKALERDIEPLLASMGKALGAPWQAKHKLAAAAALAAHGRERFLV